MILLSVVLITGSISYLQSWQGRAVGEITALLIVIVGFIANALLTTNEAVRDRAPIRDGIREALEFLTPLLGHALAFVLIGTSVRALVIHDLGLDAGAMFILAATLASMVSFSHEALMRAWNPFYYERIKCRSNISLIRKVQVGYSLISVVIYGCFFLFITLGFDLFFDERYQDAKVLALWLGLAFSLEGVRKILVSYIYLSGKRYIISLISAVGVIVSVAIFFQFAHAGVFAGVLAIFSAFTFTLLATIAVRIYISRFDDLVA